MTGYLLARQSEPCTRNALLGAHTAIAFMEDVAGVEQSEKLTGTQLYAIIQKEILANTLHTVGQELLHQSEESHNTSLEDLQLRGINSWPTISTLKLEGVATGRADIVFRPVCNRWNPVIMGKNCRTDHLGISERRSQWMIRWAQKILDSASVNVSAFEEGLGRAMFVAGAL